ncbi:MAG: monofunctional biosynthetic peptidoglycan transglycosylase, partial [Gemmatimonadetes bacterium]|nr:monofunctional biosynthetic peptidoglycan transglycosylase [Gemmatimonadota bacterium]
MRLSRRLRQVSFILAAAAVHAAGIAAVVLYLRVPDVRPLSRGFPEESSYMRLRAREAQRGFRLRHRPVPLSQISQNLRRAVIVAEDASFYLHHGVDWYEFREAIREAVRERRPPRGASTITQQLARNLYLTPSRSLLRKLEEFLIGRRLERELPKRRILELYLNVVEWGPGIFGAEAAARFYYGIPASDIGLRQAAELAATLPQPLRVNPADNPRRLRWRTELVLRRLLARGLGEEPGAGIIVAPPEVVRKFRPLPADSVSADSVSADSLPPDTLPAPDTAATRDTLAAPDSVSAGTAPVSDSPRPFRSPSRGSPAPTGRSAEPRPGSSPARLRRWSTRRP